MRFYKIILFFLIFSLLIDPTGDFYHLKYISSITSCLFFVVYFFFNGSSCKINKSQFLILTIFCIIMPVYGLLVTFFSSEIYDIKDTSYLGFSLLLLTLTPVIFIEKKVFLNTLVLVLRFLAFVIVIILFSFLYDLDSIGLAQFFINKKSMIVGFREYAGIQTYYLYFTASPMLIILVAHDSYVVIKKVTLRNVFLCILSTVSIFLSGTRFNMLMALVILPVTLLICNVSVKNISYYFMFITLLTIGVFQSSFINSFFSSGDDSNSVKIGYIDTYISIFQQPEALFLGQGFNAAESSILFKNMLFHYGNEGVKTELTLIELFRVFGLTFGGILNAILYSLPFFLYRKIKKINFIIIGVTFYLISSLLNPYVFSTNGVVLFLLILVCLKNEFTKEKYLIT